MKIENWQPNNNFGKLGENYRALFANSGFFKSTSANKRMPRVPYLSLLFLFLFLFSLLFPILKGQPIRGPQFKFFSSPSFSSFPSTLPVIATWSLLAVFPSSSSSFFYSLSSSITTTTPTHFFAFLAIDETHLLVRFFVPMNVDAQLVRVHALPIAEIPLDTLPHVWFHNLLSIRHFQSTQAFLDLPNCHRINWWPMTGPSVRDYKLVQSAPSLLFLVQRVELGL